MHAHHKGFQDENQLKHDRVLGSVFLGVFHDFWYNKSIKNREGNAVADSSKDLQLRELKDMINDLKKMIKTLQATVDAANKREEALTQERDNLKEEVDLLRKKLFGSSSEKRSMEIPGQLNLFNEAELEQDPTITKPEAFESLFPEKETKKRKSLATNAALCSFSSSVPALYFAEHRSIYLKQSSQLSLQHSMLFS